MTPSSVPPRHGSGPAGCWLSWTTPRRPPWSWTPHEHYQFPSPAGTLAAAGLGDGWQTELAAARQRVATGPDGITTAMVTDNVIAARRT